VSLHGNAGSVYCADCTASCPLQLFRERLRNGEAVPPCLLCGGILRLGCTLFGEPLLPQVLDKAKEALVDCDLLIVVGSSLNVEPANKLPGISLNNGSKVVIINMEETMYDPYAHLLISCPAALTLSAVLSSLSSSSQETDTS